MNLDQMRQFLGLCALLNVAILFFCVMFFTLFKGSASGLHSQVFGVDPCETRIF
jgi:hypothetical protein